MAEVVRDVCAVCRFAPAPPERSVCHSCVPGTPPPATLRWAAAPTRPGWYWLRSPGGSVVRVREVWETAHGLRLEDGGGQLWPLDTYAGYSFAGPIPEPGG